MPWFFLAYSIPISQFKPFEDKDKLSLSLSLSSFSLLSVAFLACSIPISIFKLKILDTTPNQISFNWKHTKNPLFCFKSLSLMAKCFSLTASRDWCYRYTFAHAGLKSVSTDLGDGTIIHCWVPKTYKPTKPNLLLIHGFGANAMWQWGDLLRPFVPRFNLYIPDLLFFGESFTTRPERSESFQAQCLMKLMEVHNVQKLSLIGVSYGGFVGYSLAAQFPEAVEKVVLCCAGVCLEEKDLREGLFKVSNLDEAASILLPQTPEKLRTLVRMSFVKPAKTMPSWFLRDFIEVMCTEYIKEKKELLQDILKDRQLSNLPKITQPTLIVWGEQDQVFPLELGHRLNSHLGDIAELVVIKNAGHAVNLEKAKELYKYAKAFLVDHFPVPDQDLSNQSLNHENNNDDH